MSESEKSYIARLEGADGPVRRRRVRWRGHGEFVLWDTETDAWLLTDETAIERCEQPYAWVWLDAIIYRHGRAVGTAATLECLTDWCA